MDMEKTVCTLIIAALVVPAASLASPPPGDSSRTAPVAIATAATCPALFGSAAIQHRNTTWRARHLDWIEEEDSGVTVAHVHALWSDPVAIAPAGLTVVAIRRLRGKNAAIIQLSRELRRSLHCAAGPYLVKADVMLGLRLRILHVLQTGVLVEAGGRLAFIAARGALAPRWLMGWSMRNKHRRTHARLIRRAP